MILFLIAIAGMDAAGPQYPGEILAGLSGSCFNGPLPNGGSDIHCFTAAPNGRLALEVQTDSNPSGKITYQGVTVYIPTRDGKVNATYSPSLGDIIPGTVTRTGDELDFILTVRGQPVPVIWKLSGDGFDRITPNGTVHFTRTGPAGAGGL